MIAAVILFFVILIALGIVLRNAERDAKPDTLDEFRDDLRALDEIQDSAERDQALRAYYRRNHAEAAKARERERDNV